VVAVRAVVRDGRLFMYLESGAYVSVNDKELVEPLGKLGLKWVSNEEIVIETNRKLEDRYEITAYLKSGWKITVWIYKNGRVEARISHACSPRTVDVLR